MKRTTQLSMPQDVKLSLRKPGFALQRARKGYPLGLADLAAVAFCSIEVVRRLEVGGPGVSVGVLAVILWQLDQEGLLGELIRLKNSSETRPQEQTLLKRVRRRAAKESSMEALPISAAQFWNMKREVQRQSQALVCSAQVPQRALYLLRSEDLYGAKINWPSRSASARGLRRQGSGR